MNRNIEYKIIGKELRTKQDGSNKQYFLIFLAAPIAKGKGFGVGWHEDCRVILKDVAKGYTFKNGDRVRATFTALSDGSVFISNIDKIGGKYNEEDI